MERPGVPPAFYDATILSEIFNVNHLSERDYTNLRLEAGHISPFETEDRSLMRPSGIYFIFRLTPENFSTFISHPILVSFPSGKDIILLFRPDNNSIYILSTGESINEIRENIRNQVPENKTRLLLPDINSIQLTRHYSILPLAQLPEFSRQALNLVYNRWRRGLPSYINNQLIILPDSQEERVRRRLYFESVREETPYETNIIHKSYQSLLRQLYGLQVKLPEYLIINGLRVNFISFEQVSNMLKNNEIDRYIIDLILQPWAGLPGTTNRIITLFNKNGTTYLARVRYDLQTNQIYKST